MSRSMTAYGRSSGDFPFGKLVVEIHSVNRKVLDVSIYLPKELLRFDMALRKWISPKIERGQVSVRISLDRKVHVSQLVTGELKRLQKQWHEVARELGFDPQRSIDLPFLIGQLQQEISLESEEEEKIFKTSLHDTLQKALQQLLEMKTAEGEILSEDIYKRLLLIEEQVDAIEKRSRASFERQRQKMIDRLQQLYPKDQMSPELNDRLLQELVFLAERLDITEELVRLRAHSDRFKNILNEKNKVIGRTLEFLGQEMLREVNTLGSKSADADIATSVVMIKGELEKIREQVQNIE